MAVTIYLRPVICRSDVESSIILLPGLLSGARPWLAKPLVGGSEPLMSNLTVRYCRDSSKGKPGCSESAAAVNGGCEIKMLAEMVNCDVKAGVSWKAWTTTTQQIISRTNTRRRLSMDMQLWVNVG